MASHSCNKGGWIRLGTFITALIAPAGRAWALQPHEGIEGLVTHEVGHLFFIGGMVFMLVRGKRHRWLGPGWIAFNRFIWLVLAWNIVAFAGHWIELYIPADQYIKAEGETISFILTDALDLVYYASILDHLFLLPALVFLLLALRRFRYSGGEAP